MNPIPDDIGLARSAIVAARVRINPDHPEATSFVPWDCLRPWCRQRNPRWTDACFRCGNAFVNPASEPDRATGGPAKIRRVIRCAPGNTEVQVEVVHDVPIIRVDPGMKVSVWLTDVDWK